MRILVFFAFLLASFLLLGCISSDPRVPLEVAKKDPSACERAGDQYWKDDCYFLVAMEKKNSSFCTKIVRQDAIDECYLNSGQITDSVICEKINASYKRDECLLEVLRIDNLRDPSICDKFSLAGRIYRDECYSDFAAKSGDMSLCQNVTPHQANNCYLGVIDIKNQDSSICEKIKDRIWSGYCYSQFYRRGKTLNVSISEIKYLTECRGWPSPSHTTACYRASDAARKLNISVCDGLTDGYEKLWCYIRLAELTQNVSICKKTEGTFSSRCYAEVAAVKNDSSICELEKRDRNFCFRLLSDLLKQS